MPEAGAPAPDDLVQDARRLARLLAGHFARRTLTVRRLPSRSDERVACGPMASFDEAKIERGVRMILEGIGEDVDRGGLKDTPARVALFPRDRRWRRRGPTGIVTVVEGADFDEMIMVRDIPLYSIREHHLIPFSGQAHVAYVPNKAGQITGWSKIARTSTCSQKSRRWGRQRRADRDRRQRSVQRSPRASSRRDRSRALLHDDAWHQEAKRGHGWTSAVRGLFRTDSPCTRQEARHNIGMR